MRIANHSDGVNAVREWCSRQGYLALKYTTGQFRTIEGDRIVNVGQVGASDTVVCAHGLLFGIEVKVSDGDRQKKGQKNFEKALTEAGGTYVLADFRKGRDGLKIVEEAIAEKIKIIFDNMAPLIPNLNPHMGQVAKKIIVRDIIHGGLK